MPWQDLNVPENELKAFDREFKREAKFYTDDNIELFIVEILRDLGLKVITAAEAGLSGRDDAEHRDLARKKNLVLLTKDQDFLDDRKHPPDRCPGIIVFNTGSWTRETLTDALFMVKAVFRPYRDIWKGTKTLLSQDHTMAMWMWEHDAGRRTKTRYRLLNGRTAQEWVGNN